MHVSTLDGAVTAARLLGELYLDSPENCQGRTCWLVDMQKASIDMSATDVQNLASHLLGFRGRSPCNTQLVRVATVVEDDASFGMLRMLQAYLSESVDLHVSRSYDEAENWLNNQSPDSENENPHPETELNQCA